MGFSSPIKSVFDSEESPMPKRKAAKTKKVTKSTKKVTKGIAKKTAPKKPTVKKSTKSAYSSKTNAQVASTSTSPHQIGKAKTIVYIHGIANKPQQEILKCQWDHALYGYDLGERSRFAYWVSRAIHPTPYPGTCNSGDQVATMAMEDESRLRSLAVAKDSSSIQEYLESKGLHPTKAQLEELKSLQEIMLSEIERGDESNIGAQAYLLPSFPNQATQMRWMEKLTGMFLPDVYEYFYDKTRRDQMRESLLSRLRTGGGPFVIVAHSQGSMIAYDLLSQIEQLEGTKIEVELFLTLGSPLGIPHVRRRIGQLTNQTSGLMVPPNVKQWINIVDRLDYVGVEKNLSKHYKPRNGVGVQDFVENNKDWDPHSATGYLNIERVQSSVRQAVDGNLFQPMQKFTISKDLAKDLEANHKEFPHPVLIELVDPSRTQSSASKETPEDRKEAGKSTNKVASSAKLTRKEVHGKVVEWIKRNVPKDGRDLDLEDTMENYVSARLTRSEVERMANDLGSYLDSKSIHRIYRDAEKKTFLKESSEVIQATAGRVGYGATGKRICWAVIDTGIDSEHPHFKTNNTIEAIFDCTQTGAPKEALPGAQGTVGFDGNGHGTHVAGIIAGRHKFDHGEEICGIAPDSKLRIYKSLRDDGKGNDAKIIKALEHIYNTNEQATDLAIHGVNLSLGGSFDPEAFGCGDSPICKTLRRLWRQGVFVVLAAGNEGYLELPMGQRTMGINRGLSIGDPANMQEGVCVGSIHKRKPHMYGVSYFSSRGPTADGRMKPDLVAPGEQILSCRAGVKGLSELKDLYIERSGTSMAAPHVSGLVAAFLSVRREFIGSPDRTKTLLLEHCTDLGRQQASQGAGMPNLAKLLMNT